MHWQPVSMYEQWSNAGLFAPLQLAEADACSKAGLVETNVAQVLHNSLIHCLDGTPPLRAVNQVPVLQAPLRRSERAEQARRHIPCVQQAKRTRLR